MLPNLRSVTLAGVVALGALFLTPAREAKAQIYLSTPGFSLGLGVPPAYPAYGVPVYPAYRPVYPAVVPYPVVRPYAYPYAYRPGFYGYGPRPYYGYRGYGYRRW